MKGTRILGICFIVVAVLAAILTLVENGKGMTLQCNAAGDDLCWLGIPWFSFVEYGILSALGLLLAGGLLGWFWLTADCEQKWFKAAYWLQWISLGIFILGTLYVGSRCLTGLCDLGAGLFYFLIVLPLAGIPFGAGMIAIAVWWIRKEKA